MSDAPMGPGWWMASDGKWYPPQPTQAPPTAPPPPVAPVVPPAPSMPPPVPYPPHPADYGYTPVAAKPKSSTDAIVWVSLGFGVAAVIFSFLCGVFGVPLGIVSFITGIVGLSQKKKKNEPQNKWAAWVGIGAGVLSLVVAILMVVLVVTTSSPGSFS